MFPGKASPANAAQPSLVRRRIIAAGTLTVAAMASRPSLAIAAPNAEILRAEEGIHQERVFKAKRRRVYEALTVESQFDRIIQLSGVMNAGAMATMRRPTKLSTQEGSTFELFGGYIVGRQIELVPDELIVQAWRVVKWPRGTYSIVRFALTERGGSTGLVFDHRAFPAGQAEHLASGWQEHYWDPLARLLA